MDRKKALRIVVPVLIVLVIIGIWAYKNTGGNDNAAVTPTVSGSGEASLTDEEQADFALDAAGLDMEKLESYGLPIIVDFGADWCGPCQQFAPVYDAVHDEMLGKAILKYVDVDEYSDIASDFPVSVIPTQVFINADGTPYSPSSSLGIDFNTYTDKDSGETVFTTHEGALTADQLRAILDDMGESE